MPVTNYLHDELDHLVQRDSTTWEFLQKGSLDGVWYWDLENPNNEWMSPEFWELLGIDPSTKRHDPAEWQDLIFADDLAVAMDNFHAHCADPSHPYDQTVRYRHADGSTVWVRCRGMAIRDAAGKPIRMLGAHTDLTAVKKSEESAKEAWRAADAANDELRTFAYSVSHDLKAPANTLHLLLSEMDMHMGAQFDDEARSLFTMCTQTVGRMQALIDYLLDYTRIIGMKPELEPVPLHDAVEDAIGNLRASIEERSARITVAPLPRILAVRPQMSVYFQNMISNAIKYCPADRTPEVHVEIPETPRDEPLSIVVRDNGIGIPEDSQDRIFRLFQRLHGQDEIEGVGLGLPLCQHIAMNHQGSIAVTSTPGQGSAFALHLPRSAIA